ncbi:MAG: flagellar biosynthetic protein FliQ [Rhizobiales bacterium]|nr:flagellar biosynthetic protein FliQ [Hyphomicrobiales bacterium]
MNAADAIDLLQSAIWLMIVGAGPPILAAAAIGTLVALFQALTQIQESTLTFLPKIVVMALAFAVSASTVGAHVSAFSERVYAHVEHGFGR